MTDGGPEGPVPRRPVRRGRRSAPSRVEPPPQAGIAEVPSLPVVEPPRVADAPTLEQTPIVEGANARGPRTSQRRPRRRGRREGGAPAAPAPQEPPSLTALPQQDVAPASAGELAEQPVAAAGEAAPGGIETDSVPQPAVQRRSTGRTKATVEVAESPVAVNVLVPRGLGRKVDSKLIQRVVQLALQREGWSHPATLDVVLVGDDEMREINVTRRGIDEATDVLSFPLLELRPGAALAEDFFVLPPESALHLGDVVIAYSRVEAQALEAGHSKERELAFLTVHAVLHILGYDHDTEPRRRQMRRREEDVLIELGLRRNGHRSAE